MEHAEKCLPASPDARVQVYAKRTDLNTPGHCGAVPLEIQRRGSPATAPKAPTHVPGAITVGAVSEQRLVGNGYSVNRMDSIDRMDAASFPTIPCVSTTTERLPLLRTTHRHSPAPA